MTLDEFWDHIRATKRRDPESHEQRLVKRLTKLSPDEILDFDHWWAEVKSQAYFWDLWGAAYLINGGCSDDGFIDFRSWLVLQGRKVFETAMKNPDSLAEVADPDEDEMTCECYPGSDAWFRATGKDSDYDALHAAREVRHPVTQEALAQGAPEPRGENWDFDDDAQVRKRLPRLAKMYLDRD